MKSELRHALDAALDADLEAVKPELDTLVHYYYDLVAKAANNGESTVVVRLDATEKDVSEGKLRRRQGYIRTKLGARQIDAEHKPVYSSMYHGEQRLLRYDLIMRII